MRPLSVLLVEADPEERERFGTWLDEAGFEVVTCPGPTGPDYTCLGGREGTCPLVVEADAVVIDLALESEIVLTGPFAEELLALYAYSDKPLVVLGRKGRTQHVAEGRIARVGRHPARDELVGTVRRLLALAATADA